MNEILKFSGNDVLKTKRQLSALYRFSQNEEWGENRGWLRDNIHRLSSDLSKERDNVNLRWKQGQLAALIEFEETVVRARERADSVLPQIGEDGGKRLIDIL